MVSVAGVMTKMMMMLMMVATYAIPSNPHDNNRSRHPRIGKFGRGYHVDAVARAQAT